MPLAPHIRHRIKTACPPRMAARYPRQPKPEPAPRAVEVNRVQRVFRARWQMPALAAKEPRQRVAVGDDRGFEEECGEARACTFYPLSPVFKGERVRGRAEFRAAPHPNPLPIARSLRWGEGANLWRTPPHSNGCPFLRRTVYLPPVLVRFISTSG